MLDQLKQQSTLYMNSKSLLIIAALLFTTGAALNAQQTDANVKRTKKPSKTVRMDNGVDVRDSKIERNPSGDMTVELTLDFENAKRVRANRQLQVIPSIAGPKDTLMLARLSIIGRNRFFYYLRNSLEMKVSEYDQAWQYKELPDTFRFRMPVPYEAWMDSSRVMVNECVLGCCNKTLGEEWEETPAVFVVPVCPEYQPVFVYRKPKAEIHKTRALNATSYVDFPVSETVIYPRYRENERELAAIVETINKVLQDKDVTITSINLCGFASPESPYSNNVRLASGRTASIKQYISKFNHIDPKLIHTNYVPENWEGLRAWILDHNVVNGDEIVAIIDNGNIAPDPKEALIKKKFPVQYKYLLDNCYPGLRKVDYTIEYDVKHFVTVEEIMAAYNEDPSKLSKDEYYLLASSLPEGDPLHDQLLLDAVKHFPADPATNLNAANVAMKAGDLRTAGSYLEKAGDTLEAMYARGVYAALLGEYDKADELLGRVGEHVQEAPAAQAEVQTIIQYNKTWNK